LPEPGNPFSLRDKIIRTVTEDSSGNIWVGTKTGGLSLLRSDGKSFQNYVHNNEDETTLSNDCIYAIVADKDGKLWIGTEDGLNIFDPHSGKALRVVNDRRNKYGFAGKSVHSIFIGKDGIYWIGTEAGINKYDKNLAFFNLKQSNPLDPSGLSSSTITSFIENPSGDIYVGTDGGGLNLYHRKTGLFDHVRFTSGNDKKARSILAMERAGDELWIGTYPDGVYVLNMLTGKTRNYTKGNGAGDLPNNEIFCLKKDSKGIVWIGTNGNGFCKYDQKSGTFKRFDPKDPKTGHGILPSNGFIRSIEEDRFGRMWIGSYGAGIAIYDEWRGTFQLLNHENSGLAQDNVLSIYNSRAGKIWAGTAGEGLCLFDYNTNKFVTYAEAQGLANGYIYKILEDEAGKLWLSTNKGISSFDPQTGKFKNYSYYHGLQPSTFNLGAGLITSSGDMFFGGLDGFNYFNPLTLHSNKNVPSLVFTDLKISNRSVTPGDHSAITSHISVAKEINLSYKQNFSIDFAALNYTVPQENQYAYKLDGFETNWNDVGSSKTAVYTNLPPGKYTFKLKARSDDGLWNTPETSINIYVKPPFWRTSYAYVLYFLIIAFILWAIRYRGIQKLKRRFALEQERQQFRQMLEEERREAERKHEFDEVKIKFLTNLSHEFRTPISLIMGPVEKLVQHEVNDKKLEQLSLVRRNARRLLNLVNQLLDFRKLEESELKLNLTHDDMIYFVKEVGDSFKDISNRKQIHFTFTSDVPHFYTSFDKDKIERILFNLLSNAFKFTKEDGKIWLKVEKYFDFGIKLVVADTGVGMTKDIQDKIFERFFQGDANASIMNQGTGIGLSITREFVKLHGGTIDVESIQGKGTTFTVQLPCTPIPKSVEDATLVQIKGEEQLIGDGTAKEVAANEKPTVLLIEDHDDFRKYLSDNLSSYYKIVEASDGRQGWQKILSTHPQVIVSDINMPEMDGILLCRKIRSDKRTSHIPIILLTALTGDTHQLRGLSTGANDYLTKPFNFDILYAKIRNLLHLNQNLKSVYSRQLNVTTPAIEVQSEDEKLLLRITQYIESNLDSPDLSVEDLSKHVYMSRGTLYSKIVSLTGETPVEFIRSIKLNKAAALLENSDMKISQIGYEVGFTTPNYFARAFKAKFNLSPSEYMNLKRKHR
jgi:signal transduction histidine kinase/ligand-binding sensor domain-containing protein/DNA-binding response OmpR family regulator